MGNGQRISGGCTSVFSWYIIVTSLLTAQPHLAGGQADNLGKEFIIVFMKNEVENPQQLPLELFITTPSTIPVQVRIRAPKFTDRPIDITTTVVSGEVEKVEVSHLLRMHWTGIEGKVILIEADSEVVVYGLNKEKFSTDGFLAYPTDVIGYEYYTVSHSPTNSYTEFAVAARHDDTSVSILFPNRRLGAKVKVEYQGKTYGSGSWLNITLKAYEAFQCLSLDRADLTTTYIISDKPIAVFSGNTRTWVGESNSRDHLAIQLPPIQAYGKQFPIIPIPGRTVGDVIKIISPTPGTSVRIVNSGLPRREEGGEVDSYHSIIIPSGNYTTISATHPILVVQVSQSQQAASEPGDPTMLVVTATPQFNSDYVFSTPQYSAGGSYTNYLMCVIKKTEVDGLMFDGKPFSRLKPVWKPFPETDLVGTEVRISEGAHSIKHISPVAMFSGYVYGTANKESYSFQIGTRLASINQPCVTTPSVFGDGVDNDCDGLIDEELCTGASRGTDTDGDEAVDEDCALTRVLAEGAPDSGGRQFMIYFMENNVEAPRYLPLEVYVTPVRAASASVRIESPKWFEPAIREDATIAMGSVKKFNIPYTMREKGTTMTSKALFITADADVVVYGVNKELYSADAFLALPLDVLGRKYFAVTHWPNSAASFCQLGVIGVRDGTKVDITFPPATGRGHISIEYNEKTYSNGDTLTVAINRFSTLQLQSRGDLSGTMIMSTQKVAVLSGNIRTAVGSGSSRDHLVAMLPPVESWGKYYCTVPIPGRTTGDYFYVMASENNTAVQMTNRVTVTLHAGESRMILIGSDEYVAFQADKPILLTQLSQSQRTTNEIGDPTMIVLPSQEQWGNAYTFSTTSNSYNGVTNTMYNNYIVMVAPSNKTAGIIFDGQYMRPLFASWVPIADTPYSGTSFAVQNGVHTIQHEDPTVTMSVVVYGNADKESYGFPAGMRLADINAPCETTFTVAGDGIDNDCDGKIDEEICEGAQLRTDEDGDGMFNEDCAIVSPPPPPPTPQTTAAPPTPVSATTAKPVTPAVVIGPPGPAGEPGAQGMPGPQGPPGLNGVSGKAGTNGLPGQDGIDGKAGAAGGPGENGEVGATGEQGADGTPGAAGTKGPQGLTGAIGDTGAKGNRGISVKGIRGFAGVPGALGPPGGPGAKGNSGAAGSRGVTGERGSTGATGVKGEHGDKGEMGPSYQDVDECTEDTHQCSDGCVNIIGSYTCSCPDGYVLDDGGKQCEDKDECAIANGGCMDLCKNLIGSFNCSCTGAGYHLAKDMKTCVDSDECTADNPPCTDGDECTADNPPCTDSDECTADNPPCTEEQMCINSVGGFSCFNITQPDPVEVRTTPQTQPPQLTGCAMKNGGCADKCSDTEDTFYCSCQQPGYRLSNNAQTCIDIDECEIGNHDCAANTQSCVNSYGSYFCINITLPGIGASITPVASKVTASELINVNGNLVLAMLLWLCVLSFILLLILILVLVQHCRHTKDKEEYAHALMNLNDIHMLIEDKTPPESPELHRNDGYDIMSNSSTMTIPSTSRA